MFRRLFGFLLSVVLIISIFTACASKADYSPQKAATGAAPAPREETTVNYSTVESMDMDSAAPENKTAREEEAPMADSLAGSSGSVVDVSNAILAERKIIRSANLTIEVENFDAAFSNIESIILGIGIIQETNINTERYYVDNEQKLIKSGTIVLRVDKSKFDSVIGKLKGIGDVFNYTTNGQDVTDKYVDVESRLRLLRMEQSKLEAYLAKLDDLDKIFRTESRLTDIRFEIEGLTGNLNKLNSLIELSTITVSMNEKRPGYNPKPPTYGEKLLNSLKGSLLEIVDLLGNLLIFIVGALPVLIVLGLFILLGLFIYRRIPKKRNNLAPPVKAEYPPEDNAK